MTPFQTVRAVSAHGLTMIFEVWLASTSGLSGRTMAGIITLLHNLVTPDARFHEVEAIGYPRGPEGFEISRRQVNAAIPDERIFRWDKHVHIPCRIRGDSDFLCVLGKELDDSTL